jgi:hypothetical protein
LNRHPIRFEAWWGKPPHGDLILKSAEKRDVIDAMNDFIAEHPQRRYYVHIFVFQGTKRGVMDILGRITWKANEK